MIVFLVISIIPALAVGLITYVNTEREITEETINKLSSLASVQEDAINIVMQNNIERLVAFTTRLQMKIELDNFNRNADSRSQEFIENLILGTKAQIGSIREISVLNPEGVVVASTDNEEIDVNHSNDEFFLKGRVSNDVTLFFKDKSGSPSLYLVGPLVLDGKLVGVAAITSDVASIYSITGIHSELSETGESYLVKRDENGGAQIITPLRFEPDAVLNTSISKEDLKSPATQALLGNERTFVDAMDYRGKSVLATTRYVEGSDLGLVVKIDKQEAFAPLDELRFFAIIAGLAGGFLIIITSFYLGHSISFPITRLRDRVVQMSKGGFDADIDERLYGNKDHDEIAELAFHFDEMRKNVKYTNENLQQAVKEKTKELEAAITALQLNNVSLQELNEMLAQQKDELRKNEIARQEFSAMITHELKTPLVAIIGYGSMLLHGKLGELAPVQRQKLQVMHKNAERLTELIQDILDVQKLELGELHLDIKQASARDIIVQSINSLKPHAESKGVRLSNGFNNDLRLECDSGRIIQVLSNLVNNGIKFSPSNSKIDIDAKLEDHSVVFTIKDSGIGIPAEKQDKLFTKFYQVDTSLTRKAGGTGLGLVISKGIVEAHKGKIWFESETGKGSIFSFSLPIGGKVGEQENTHG